MRSLLVLGSCLVASSTFAQRIPTCVTVEAAEPEGLRSLVHTEIDRHRSHRVADPCMAHVRVELIEADGRRHLTGRLDDAVPHRIEVDELAEDVEELVTILLHNDPERLRRPEEDRGLGGALGRLRREGATLWSIELYELLGMIDGRIFAAPGLALAYRREHAQWALALHVAIATRTARTPRSELALMAVGDVAFDVRYAFSADAETSGFFGLQIGIEHQWLRGPLASDPNRRDSANRTGLFVAPRVGVELFRTTRSRLELFVQANLPLFRARDEENEVVKAWFPTARMGIALGL